MAPNKKETVSRMNPEQLINFNCFPGVPCFTQCCQDITIVLTPYDLLRIKNGMGISSGKFLDELTIIIPKKKRLIPLVMLKMLEEDKRCPLLTQKGCKIYDNRPWPCRMFPLDMNDDATFTQITTSSRCQGLKEKNKWPIGEWLLDQGVAPYDEMNRLFSEITNPLRAQELEIENPQIAKMVFMALYNLDRFREFIFQSTFLDRFEVEPKRIEKIKRNDIELLKFSFDWIKFGIFGQKLFWVKQSTP